MQDFFHYSDLQKRKSLIALLIKTAKSDFKNHSNELRFITDVATSLKLSEEDVMDIRAHLNDFEYTFPTSEEERMLFLIHVLHLIKIDWEITHHEKEMTRKIALQLALNPMLVEELLMHYEKELRTGKIFSEKELTVLIRKYLN